MSAAWFGLALMAAPALAAAPTAGERDGVWAQDYSDLKADPAVRFGQLPNGMRYAVMHNATPPHQVSMRFRIATGSLAETDAQQGLAHFLEHMAFKGSKKVPGGDMVKILERLGLAFGADTNASTSWDQTIYTFDLPQNDPATIDTGLMLMRETASELLLEPAALESERGVILSEERVRDTPGYRAGIAEYAFLLDGQLVSKRFPIGKVDVIKTTPVARMADYYRKNYRPERATLVVAGDVDAGVLAAKIEELFTGWRNPTPAPAAPDLGQPATRGEQIGIAVQAVQALDLGIAWVQPYDNAADTSARRKRDTLRRVAMAVLNRRFETLAQAAQPSFLRASVGWRGVMKSADVIQLSVGAAPDDWRKALVAAETARRQAVMYGVRQDEVDREITEGLSARKNAVAAAATRRTPQLASAILGAAAGNDVFTTPAENLALFEESVKGVTAEDINQFLRDAFQGQGPLIFLATPKAIEGGEAAVAAAFHEAQDAKIATLSAAENKTWKYANSFGAPGKVASKREIPDLGVTFVRFANGTRLTVKPTKFTDDQIQVNVRIGNGLRDLPADRAPVTWALSGLVAGGLKDLTFDEVQRIFTAETLSVGPALTEEALELRGVTRPTDLDAQMQLLTAFMTAPGYRPEAFERVRTSLLARADQVEATPGGVLGQELSQLIHDGDARWHAPGRTDLTVAKSADLENLLQPFLANGEIEVVIVGDTTVEKVITAVSATFGAVSPRTDATKKTAKALSVKSPPVNFPAATPAPITLMHTGREDQGMAVLAWPTDDFFTNTQRAREVRMAEQILQLRLVDQFRVAEGNTYSPGTAYDASQVFRHYGFVMARIETPPDKIAHFFADASAIADAIARNGVTEDELQRAKKPRLEALQKAQQTNGYWLGALGGVQTDPQRLTAIRMTLPGLEKVTAADVKRTAALYLKPDRAWKLAVVPKGAVSQ